MPRVSQHSQNRERSRSPVDNSSSEENNVENDFVVKSEPVDYEEEEEFDEFGLPGDEDASIVVKVKLEPGEDEEEYVPPAGPRRSKRAKKSSGNGKSLDEKREQWRREKMRQRSSMNEEEAERRRAIERERKREERARKRKYAKGKTKSARRSSRRNRSNPPRKKVSEMTPEELAENREKWRKEKQAQRRLEKLIVKAVAGEADLTESGVDLDPEKAKEIAERLKERNERDMQRRREKRLRSNNGSKKGRSTTSSIPRSKLTPEQRVEQRREKRRTLSEEKIRERNQRMRLRRLQRLAEMTEEEKRQMRMANYMRHVAKLAQMTPEEREEKRKRDREKRLMKDAVMSEEKRQEKLRKKREYARRHRKTNRTHDKRPSRDRRNYREQRKERLIAEGKWEEFVQRRRAKARAKIAEMSAKRKLLGDKYIPKKRVFKTPEAEARYRECKRISGAKYYLRKKLVAAGASEEEIEFQLNELVKTSCRQRAVVPRKRRKNTNNVNPADEDNNSSQSLPQTTPENQLDCYPQQTYCKDDGSNSDHNNTTNMTFNPFSLRWGYGDPLPASGQNFPPPVPIPTATTTSSSMIVNNAMQIPNPLPLPAHHQQLFSMSSQNCQDFMDSVSASSSHYDYGDTGEMDFSPPPTPGATTETPEVPCIQPPILPTVTHNAEPDPNLVSSASAPVKPKRQRNSKAQKLPTNNIAPCPKPAQPSQGESSASASSPQKKKKRTRAGGYRPLYQNVRPTLIPKNHKCLFCGNMYTRRTILNHMRNLHHPYFKKGKCRICGEEFPIPRFFHTHFRNVHGGTGDVRKGDITYTNPSTPLPPQSESEEEVNPNVQVEPIRDACCEECGNVYQRDYITAHKRLYHHPQYKNGACQICGEKFFTGPKFYDHFKAVHHDVKDPEKEPYRRPCQFVCEECGHKCPSKWYLDQHIYYKHGEGTRPDKYFTCPYCPGKIQIKRRDNLKKHFRRFHPNMPIPGPFVCPQEGCPHTFLQEKILPVHAMKEHPEKCFVCQYCKVVKFSPLTLNFHYSKCRRLAKVEFHKMKKEIGDNSIDRILTKCELCKGQFKLGSLERHYKARHGAKEELFQCFKCDKKLLRRELIGMHMIDLHRSPPEEWLEGISKLNCDISTVTVEPKSGKSKRNSSRRKTSRESPKKRGRPKRAKVQEEEEVESSDSESSQSEEEDEQSHSESSEQEEDEEERNSSGLDDDHEDEMEQVPSHSRRKMEGTYEGELSENEENEDEMPEIKLEVEDEESNSSF